MRLNEVAHHTWDVTVGLDPAATVDATAAGSNQVHHNGNVRAARQAAKGRR